MKKILKNSENPPFSFFPENLQKDLSGEKAILRFFPSPKRVKESNFWGGAEPKRSIWDNLVQPAVGEIHINPGAPKRDIQTISQQKDPKDDSWFCRNKTKTK